MDVLQDKDFQQNIMKFATMLSFSKSFASPDREWQMASLYILIGFGAYHAVTKHVIINDFEGPMKNVVTTWLKVGTMLTVSRALSGKPFDAEYIMDSAYTLIGFNAYDLFMNQFMPEIEDMILSKIVEDTMVVGTMSIVKQLLHGKKLNQKFFMSTFQTIAGFAVYDVISSLQ